MTFFKVRKTSKDSKRRFSIYCRWVLCSMDCLQLPFIREAVSWTHRFLTRKIWPINRRFFFFGKQIWKQKFCVSSKKEKECYRKTTSYYLSSALHAKNDTTNLFSYKLGESTENNKVLFSSQVRKQLKLLTVPSKPLRCCLRSDKLVNCHVWKFCKDLF